MPTQAIFLTPIGDPENFTDILISNPNSQNPADAQNLLNINDLAKHINFDQTLIILDNAKPFVKKINHIRHLVCLHTLRKILNIDSPLQTCDNFLDAQDAQKSFIGEFETLITQIDQKRLHKTAKLECQTIQAFADLEVRGLPINKTIWLQGLDENKNNPKILNTYGENFLAKLDSRTQSMHAHFEPIGASTGRVSCSNPNIQNLPKLEIFHKAIRSHQPNFKIISADYAGCELRVLAALSQDSDFIEAFKQNLDIHALVAKKIFGQVTPEFRQQAKAVSFGIIYGMGPGALSKSLKINYAQAENLITQYFDKYPKIKAYLDSCVSFAQTNKFSKTRLGRKLFYENTQDIARIAKNMPIQGTAADIAKLALIKINSELKLKYPEAGLINFIHDEFLAEAPKDQAQEVAELIKNCMEEAQEQICPEVKPKAEYKIAEYWMH